MASRTDPEHVKRHTAPDGTQYAFIRYVAEAGKPTLLLLHGFPSSTWDLRHLIPKLASAGVGIIAPDLLGYGDTDKPEDVESYRMKNMTTHIASICKVEGVDSLVGLGHDWGAGLLSHLWLYEPQLFTHLIYVTTGYSPPGAIDISTINAYTKQSLGYEIFGYWDFMQADDSPQVIQQNHDALQRVVYCKDPSIWKWAVGPTGALREILENKKGGDIETLSSAQELGVHAEIMLKGGYRGPTNWYRQSLRGLNKPDYEKLASSAATITVPTLYLPSMRDAVAVPALMEGGLKQHAANLTINKIDTGHWSALEQPNEVFEAIQSFLKF